LEQGILSVPGLAGYESVPARIGFFFNDKLFFIIPMANKKTGKTGTHSSADTSPVQCPWLEVQLTWKKHNFKLNLQVKINLSPVRGVTRNSNRYILLIFFLFITIVNDENFVNECHYAQLKVAYSEINLYYLPKVFVGYIEVK